MKKIFLSTSIFMFAIQFSNAQFYGKNGSVGIGTVDPEQKLDVRGRVINGGPDFILGQFDGRYQGYQTKNRALTHSKFGDQLIINYKGDFGGGTEIQSKLNVEGELNITGNLNAGASDFILGKSDGRQQGSVRKNRALVHTQIGDRLVLNYKNDFEGGVKIHSDLDIISHVQSNTGLKIDGVNGISSLGSNYLHINKYASNTVSIGHSSLSNIILANGGGKVGIGTYNPGSRLNVGTKTSKSPSKIVQFGESKPSGEARVLSLINSGGGSNQSTSLDFHNNGGWSPTGKIQVQQVDNSTKSNLHFYTYNSGLQKRMTIDEDGNVGIGVKPNNTNKLSVNGTIWATEVKISLTQAADWVFDDSYDLRPLSEVASYIKENKHLPEIPSAEEFRENDLKVSEMTNKLLQKIEELTLYTIEQEEKIKQQEERLLKLEKYLK